MGITISLGWWLAPASITIAAFGWRWWVHKDERPATDYGRIGQSIGYALTFMAALSVSLIAWLVYALST